MSIPLVDLGWQHQVIQPRLFDRLSAIMDDTAFIRGPAVADFEDAFARFIGVEHCVGVGNGTDAIELALRALGVGPGDEVIVPAHTFIASVLGVSRAGARPVLVDCDEENMLIDPARVEDAMTARTRALLPVHLYGNVAPMGTLTELACNHGLFVVEDAAQAHGATLAGARAGSFGACGCFSFYPGKNLGAYGDAGGVVAHEDATAERLRVLGNVGSESKYRHPVQGMNSRLDSLQAAVLALKLEYLERWNDMRRQAAGRYGEMLAGLDQVTLPAAAPGVDPVWHLYVIRVPDRDAVLARLHEKGIFAGVHYPIPVHLQGAYDEAGYRPGDFPVAERAARTVLSLPIYPGISPEQQERVVEGLRSALP